MSVPLLRLPAMDLLRGFVAVGRRMSITQAADDLCLSQSAISKQIRALEEALGVQLLKRGHRSIAFTAEGERLFRSADGAVQQLQDVVGTLLVSKARKPVTITASIGVAGLWLLPRLGDFQLQHPEIDVRVAANNAMLDLRSEGIDLAIRYCASTQAPAGSVRLFGETVAPVASPSLGIAPLLSEHSLANQFLLEFDDLKRPWLQWKTWLATLGWNDAKPKGILRFNQYDQVIHAAMAGQGIALGRLELLTPMLSDHRLVVLGTADAAPVDDHAYWLMQADASPRREVSHVIDWIRSESRSVLALP